MVFKPQSIVPQLAFDPPDSIPIHEFLFNDRYGRYSLAESHPAFVDGISGKSLSASQTRERIEYLARALGKELGWSPDDKAQQQAQTNKPDHNLLGKKVVCIFTLNTVSCFFINTTLSVFTYKTCCSEQPTRPVFGVGLVGERQTQPSPHSQSCPPLAVNIEAILACSQRSHSGSLAPR